MPVNPQQQSQAIPQNQTFIQPTPQIKPVKKSSFPKLLIIGVIMLVLVGVLAYTLFAIFTKTPPPVNTNSQKTITFWGRSVEAEQMKPIIDEFEASNPKIKVVYDKQVETNYREKLSTRLDLSNVAALPDIAEINEEWVDDLSSFLLPVTDQTILSRYTELSLENNSAITIEKGKSKTNTYAVPYRFNSLALAYNKKYITEYLQENKLSDIDFNTLDWSSLLTRTRALTKTKVTKDAQTRNETIDILRGGIAIGSPKTVTNADKIFQLLLIQNNANIYNATLSKFELGSKFDEVLRFYTNFNVNTGVWNDSLGNDVTSFTQGKVAMMLLKSEDIDQVESLNPNLEFVTVLPAKIGSIQNISFSRSLAVPIVKPNSAEAMKFIEFLSRPETGTKLHKANNKVTFIPAQRESLNSIPKNSPFAVFSDINPSARKFKVPVYPAVTKALYDFLDKSYQTNFAGLKPGEPLKSFDVNTSSLERELNDALPTPIPVNQSKK